MTKLPPGRQPPKGQTIPGTKTTVNLETGESRDEPMDWHVMTPAAHLCQVCAVDHDPLIPHNAQSLYYQAVFQGKHHRPVTWADAAAHCDDETKRAWEAELRQRGHWTEPPVGTAPIKHFGE